MRHQDLPWDNLPKTLPGVPDQSPTPAGPGTRMHQPSEDAWGRRPGRTTKVGRPRVPRRPGRRPPGVVGVAVALLVAAFAVSGLLRAVPEAEQFGEVPNVEPQLDLLARPRGAEGYPKGWHELRANDGTFSIVGRRPVLVVSIDGGWELDFAGGWPKIAAYVLHIGPPAGDPADQAKEDVMRWATESGTASEPAAVTAGIAQGWEVRIERSRRVEVFRAFRLGSRQYLLWTSYRPTRAAELVLAFAFLDSFRVSR